MPPRRPPPLPKELFTGNGPLAPGSAPLPPSPTSIHPPYIIDAHSFPHGPTGDAEPILGGLPQRFPRPPVKNAVEVKLDVSAEPASEVLGVKPFSIHPTILNLTLATPPSITNIAKGAVDIIVPSSSPMTDKEWDLLEEAVNALDGTWSRGDSAGGISSDAGAAAPSPLGAEGKIVISGLLPPPLTKPSGPLLQDDIYQNHLARLAQISLHYNVYLKALPPAIDVNAISSNGGGEWWTEEKELDHVLRMYVSPAIETFGTHRIIFGSSPALPLKDLALATLNETTLQMPITSDRWYGALRRTITEIGEGQQAVDDILGGNASRVYQLD